MIRQAYGDYTQPARFAVVAFAAPPAAGSAPQQALVQFRRHALAAYGQVRHRILNAAASTMAVSDRARAERMRGPGARLVGIREVGAALHARAALLQAQGHGRDRAPAIGLQQPAPGRLGNAGQL